MSDYDLLHSMLYTCLGNIGLKVSRLCLGCMSFGNQMNWIVEEDEAKQVIKRAWDLGINFFDTANSYSKGRSEEILGNFLAEINREEAVVATKVYNPMGNGVNQRGLSRKHLLWQIKQSLNRLKTDYIDIYQIHRWDYDTPIDETLCTMTNLLMENKYTTSELQACGPGSLLNLCTPVTSKGTRDLSACRICTICFIEKKSER